MGAGRGRLGKIAAIALLTLAHAAPAAALSCVFFPFQRPGERFGTKELVAHIEVLEVRADWSMDVRILRVLHGREERPVVGVDTAGALGWNMPQKWGFEPFRRSTQWVIVMLPAQKGSAAWQPQLCRAFLQVEGGSAVGYVSNLTSRDQVRLNELAARVASADLWRRCTGTGPCRREHTVALGSETTSTCAPQPSPAWSRHSDRAGARQIA